ncbi:hypothetical protein DFJ74DRAFT_604643 [Hyaloraphidium curvatum]|nr:hypothetical protein DFJ74DRAFT_604643 [Hyaloraphidium curvatum]
MPPASFRTLGLPAHLLLISRPFLRPPLGIAVGGRCTCVRLASGGLFVFSPTELDEETKKAVQEFGGRVEFLVAPDREHYLFVGEWMRAFPGAVAVGVEGVERKTKGVRWTGLYGAGGEGKRYGFEGEIEVEYVDGFANRDLLAFHRPSRTLLVADIFFNMPLREQFGPDHRFRLRDRVAHRFMRPQSWGHKVFLWLATRRGGKPSMQRAARRVVDEWKPERIVPCHGEVVEEDAVGRWGEAFRWFL